MLLLTTGMIGTFCALDSFLFYVFWEIMLIPMYFIIGLLGEPQYAAIKFVLFTMFGSLSCWWGYCTRTLRIIITAASILSI